MIKGKEQKERDRERVGKRDSDSMCVRERYKVCMCVWEREGEKDMIKRVIKGKEQKER